MELVVWPSARYSEIVIICWGLIVKLIGSDTASAPFGTMMDESPLKVNFCSVWGMMAGDPAVLL